MKTLFIVYLKLKFNWVPWFLFANSGNPTPGITSLLGTLFAFHILVGESPIKYFDTTEHESYFQPQ